MAHFIRAVKDDLRAEGLEDLVGSNVGVFWSREIRLEIAATDYLRWKAMGTWRSKGQSAYSSLSRPSANTIKGLSADLVNLLSWCETRRVDWKKLSYNHLVDHYQGEMNAGRWSLLERGRPLSPSTINRRMGTACDFLEFAADRGWREPIVVQLESVRRPDVPSRTTQARVGRMRRHPKELRLPTLVELNDWMIGLTRQSGSTAGLMVRTATLVGLRPDEVRLLRSNQLPQPINRR